MSDVVRKQKGSALRVDISAHTPVAEAKKRQRLLRCEHCLQARSVCLIICLRQRLHIFGKDDTGARPGNKRRRYESYQHSYLRFLSLANHGSGISYRLYDTVKSTVLHSSRLFGVISGVKYGGCRMTFIGPIRTCHSFFIRCLPRYDLSHRGKAGDVCCCGEALFMLYCMQQGCVR